MDGKEYVKTVRQCLRQASLRKEQVVGVCCDSSAVVPVTREGRPLRRAILWMDGRAVEEADFIPPQA